MLCWSWGAVAEWSKALLQSEEKTNQNQKIPGSPPALAPLKKLFCSCRKGSGHPKSYIDLSAQDKYGKCEMHHLLHSGIWNGCKFRVLLSVVWSRALVHYLIWGLQLICQVLRETQIKLCKHSSWILICHFQLYLLNILDSRSWISLYDCKGRNWAGGHYKTLFKVILSCKQKFH